MISNGIKGKLEMQGNKDNHRVIHKKTEGHSLGCEVRQGNKEQAPYSR
jgi:hypothetical protein